MFRELRWYWHEHDFPRMARLRVIGSGDDEELARLRAKADERVSFERVAREELPTVYAEAVGAVGRPSVDLESLQLQRRDVDDQRRGLHKSGSPTR